MSDSTTLTTSDSNANSTDAAAVREPVGILNIAAYKFTPLADLPPWRQRLQTLCRELKLRGTILLSPEGINLFVAGETRAVERLLESVRRRPELADLEEKRSWTDRQPFQRMLVKIKREIIPCGLEAIQPAVHTSAKLPANTLQQWLSDGKPLTLLDTRNDYEVQLGTFQGAQSLGIRHFRDFAQAVAQLPEETKQQPLVMFCTGGIRCEKAGPLMEQLGFEHVYQLDGGILKYFEQCGGQHYHGDCFVFDQRVAVGPDLKPAGWVSCFACQASLSQEDVRSAKYVPGESCPHCYLTDQQQAERHLERRQAAVTAIAQRLPGCQPYTSLRAMHVPRALAGLRLVDFLASFHPGIDRASWQAAVARGDIRFDGEPLTEATVVREGQRLVHHEGLVVEPEVATDIRLLYEDAALVVVDKPAPLPAHPSGRFNRNSLESFLAEVYRPEKLRMAHRLDAHTTGLMVLSRTHRVARLLQPQFEARRVRKRYLALIAGEPPQDEFVCREPISRSTGQGGSRAVSRDGLPAETLFRVLERQNDGRCLVEARPLTGRTHQIRVHLWQMGWPIVGDPMYRANQQLQPVESTLAAGPAAATRPMCLHAWQLELEHPLTGRPLRLRADRKLSWTGLTTASLP
jgi:UPF0176 protein